MEKLFRMFFSLFGLVPYEVTIKLAKLIVFIYDSKFEIWPRNSYIFDAIEPGFSDLDLTLYVPKDGDVTQAQKFLALADILRKVWPLLGEINLYYENELQASLANINSFELNRDKNLVSRINYIEKFSSIEASVFLFRQLEKDIKNLSVFPKYRLKKWNYHFRQIQVSLPESQQPCFPEMQSERVVESIISTIVFLCGPSNPIFVNDLNEKLHMYFEFFKKDVDLFKLRPLLVKDPWLFVFSVHRTAYLEISPFTLSEVQQRILSLQIKWELWGLKTQVVDRNSAKESASHRQNLFNKLERQNFYQWSEELEGLLNSKSAD